MSKPMIRGEADEIQHSKEVIEDALLEAAAFLSDSIGESVPLHDYRASVEVFASVLARNGHVQASSLALSLTDIHP
jgi:hypothetical protein